MFERLSQAGNSSRSDSSPRRALITGITGQDGSYLAELLLTRGYEVHGTVRRVAIADPTERHERIRHLFGRVHLHAASLESYASIYEVVDRVRPSECYHLAAQSFVQYSFHDAFSTLNTNINGTMHLLEAVRSVVPECRFYFAGSSEMFGQVEEIPQKETTRFHPRSPYGISKVSGYHFARHYREHFGMHVSSGILFNHESPRRGFEFVSRKITASVARIVTGRLDQLSLGNLDARRDWGHAREYVEAMWLMLQQSEPDDYVVATGKSHTVREFVELAFDHVGLNWRDYVKIDPALRRPAEVNSLLGDASKAREKLGWSAKQPFADLVHEMVDADLGLLGAEAAEAVGAKGKG